MRISVLDVSKLHMYEKSFGKLYYQYCEENLTIHYNDTDFSDYRSKTETNFCLSELKDAQQNGNYYNFSNLVIYLEFFLSCCESTL